LFVFLIGLGKLGKWLHKWLKCDFGWLCRQVCHMPQPCMIGFHLINLPFQYKVDWYPANNIDPTNLKHTVYTNYMQDYPIIPHRAHFLGVEGFIRLGED